MPPSVFTGWNCKRRRLATNEKAGAVGSGLEILPELGRSSAVTFFYELLDKVVLTACHEISGIIAVHHKQFNFVWPKVIAAAALLWADQPLMAATMAQPSKPDPLLDGGPTAPCAAGPDYAAASDVNGNPVAPPDVAARPVPVPDGIAIPLGGNPAGRRGRPTNPETLGSTGTYVSLDGRKLAPLLNPPPCDPSSPR
jgi:hypothetical protein